MKNNFFDIRELLKRRSDLNTRLSLLPYIGTPEIKRIGNKDFLYVRKRELGKLTSTYVGPYSPELHNLMLKNNEDAKRIKKELRQIEKELVKLDYVVDDISLEVLKNIDFARANMKANIYDQAVLEGVATSQVQTSDIIDNGIVNGVTPSDIQKIVNLKHAWEFILDKDVAMSKTDYYLLCQIAHIVNEGFFYESGKIRGIPVTIGGTNYIPPIPNEADVKDSISSIVNSDKQDIDKAIELCMYCMKTQVFLDGNKRTAVIFANHYLISHGLGLIVIPDKQVSAFKKLLINYYEGEDISLVAKFIKDKCWKTF